MRLGPVQGGDRREEGHLTTRRGRSQQRIEAVQPAGGDGVVRRAVLRVQDVLPRAVEIDQVVASSEVPFQDRRSGTRLGLLHEPPVPVDVHTASVVPPMPAVHPRRVHQRDHGDAPLGPEPRGQLVVLQEPEHELTQGQRTGDLRRMLTTEQEKAIGTLPGMPGPQFVGGPLHRSGFTAGQTARLQPHPPTLIPRHVDHLLGRHGQGQGIDPQVHPYPFVQQDGITRLPGMRVWQGVRPMEQTVGQVMPLPFKKGDLRVVAVEEVGVAKRHGDPPGLVGAHGEGVPGASVHGPVLRGDRAHEGGVVHPLHLVQPGTGKTVAEMDAAEVPGPLQLMGHRS